jgi:hypothetical protein
MDIDQGGIDRLVAGPAETRDVEIKAWIDPTIPQGKAKLVTALFALRNFNGGRLVIGFDDKTLQPLPPPPGNILQAYHNDDIQGLVSRHASETFDIAVGYGERERQQHPVIIVASGVRTPVAVKVPITVPSGTPLLKKGAVFFRTLRSNGTVSSAEVPPEDWSELIQICMDNREADIGRFVRRHLAGLDVAQVVGALRSIAPAGEPKPILNERALSWLDEGAAKAAAALGRWPSVPYPGIRPNVRELLRTGTWEVALVIDPPISGQVADDAFFRTVATSIPHDSSWPIWDGTRSGESVNRHIQASDGWEAFIVEVPAPFSWVDVEFQRWEPTGRFYLRRLHDDDASAKLRGKAPGFTLDLGRVASRVAEAMIAGLAIAKALGCSEDSTELGFAFRWTGLAGRVLDSWASGVGARQTIQRKSLDPDATAIVSLPLSTAASAVTPFVDAATRLLFAKFNGLAMPIQAIEHCVQLIFDGKI